MADTTNKISDSDLLMAQSAQQGMATANAIMEFARAHISRVYRLGPMDQFNMLTGEITRVKPDEPKPEDANG